MGATGFHGEAETAEPEAGSGPEAGLGLEVVLEYVRDLAALDGSLKEEGFREGEELAAQGDGTGRKQQENGERAQTGGGRFPAWGFAAVG
jgi:hypothetical protein